MGLSITVLGSSGVFATAERASSGYLVEVDDKNLWVDAGSGTWRHLLGHIDHHDLGGIVLTHRHPDHTSDVWQAVHAFKYGDEKPLAPIPLWTTQECIDALTAYSEDLGVAFDLIPVKAGDVIDFHGASVGFFEMSHIPGTVGVRITRGAGVIAYSADAGPSSDITGLADGASIFVCEATYQDAQGRWEGHLTAAEAAQLASEAGVKHLVLTHLSPGSDHERSLEEARGASTGPTVELAYDGLRLEVQ